MTANKDFIIHDHAALHIGMPNALQTNVKNNKSNQAFDSKGNNTNQKYSLKRKLSN